MATEGGSTVASKTNMKACGDSSTRMVASDSSNMAACMAAEGVQNGDMGTVGIAQCGVRTGDDAEAVADGGLKMLPRNEPDVVAGEMNVVTGEGQAGAVNQTPQDPFQALRYAELMAAQIAHSLAPRRQRKKGEHCRSFLFSGHRKLFREINLLNAARTMVKKFISHSPDILHCPHRDMLWYVTVGRLRIKISRSGHYCPPHLQHPTQWLPGSNEIGVFSSWLVQAKTALDVRWAAVRDDIAKAKYFNECRAQTMLIRSGGTVDSRLLANALGKRQPRPRMWGVAGQIDLGLRFTLCCKDQALLLKHLLVLPETEGVVRVEGTERALVMWFRGPRALGDFLACWCTLKLPLDKPPVRTLVPSDTYVAIVPDDILAVQELHLAGEGMDTESICPSCRRPEIQPIVTTAKAQPYGNSKRVVRFFCQHCCSVHDDVELAPLPPCPIPWQVWKEMRKIPSGLPPLLCRPVDMDTLEAIVRRLDNDLSMGIDGIPREFYK